MKLEKSFVLKLGPPLYRFFLARFNREIADDLVQEVFARLAESASYRQAEGNLQAFAWGVALNIQRETKRVGARDVHDEFDDSIMGATAFQPVEPSSLKIREDDFRDLRNAVNRLEPPEIYVMQLVLADLSIDEIAKHLGMPSGTVKSHVHRAKENLRTLLTEVPVNEKR